MTSVGRYAISGSQDQTVKLWDHRQQEAVRTLEGYKGWVWGVAVTPDGRYAILGAADKRLKVWNLVDGRHNPAGGTA